jgi:5-methylcytosine-specific restriction endonuclease McrA
MPKKHDRFDDDDNAEAAPELTCWLCGRVMGDLVEWHHPVPKSRGGKQREPVHPICHRTIHDNFTNSELERQFNKAEALRGHEAIGRFVDWIANKPPDFDAPTKSKR